MAMTIDEMRAKMTSVFTGAPAEVIPLQESAPVSSSSSVEALRAQLLGKMVPAPASDVTEASDPSGPPKSHRQLLEEVINNQVRAIKEEDQLHEEIRERVGPPRLDILLGML